LLNTPSIVNSLYMRIKALFILKSYILGLKTRSRPPYPKAEGESFYFYNAYYGF
jgi:hypothetical protein